MMVELLLTQMLQSKELKDDVTRFRKLPNGHPDRTYNNLIAILDEHLAYEREEKNRQAQTKAIANQTTHTISAAPAIPRPEADNVCRNFLQGKCTNNNCT